MSRIAYLNGEFLPLDEARVPVMDRGFLFADGIYEVAAVLHGRLVDNAGHLARLDRSLAVPVKKPAMCAFGGAQLDTLFVTSIRPGGDLSDQPLAGGVFALRPGVQGLPEPTCNF